MKRGILATRQELAALSERLSRAPYDAIYDTLHRRCSLILETAPVTEAQWRSLWHQGAWASAVLAARTTQGRILDLLIAHHIEPNRAYRDRAIEELKDLVSWTTWVDPCHSDVPADLCTAEAAVAATVALDWLWEDLSAADRDAVLEALRTKAIEPYLEGVKQQVAWYNTYSSWNAAVNSGCGLAALALSDELPEAEEAYAAARKGLERFFNALGREGGWDEGTGYWGLGMRYLLLLGEAASRLTDDRSLLHERGMDATGLFPVYFTPNGQPASFGDNPTVPLYGTFYLLVKYHGAPALNWWLDTYSFHTDVSTSGWSAAGLALLFRPTDAPHGEEPQLEPLKVYHEIGWAAMADTWPRAGFYVAAKTGDLGASHSQHDMNSIQVQVGGEMLLLDLGAGPYSREYLADERDAFYEVQARAHNTIVVAEGDQRIDAQGQVLVGEATDAYRWVALDAAYACGEDVQFIRHVVMATDPDRGVGEVLIVLDELTQGAPERVDLYWHTPGEVEFDTAGQCGTIRGRRSALRFALASTVRTSLTFESQRVRGRRMDHVLRLSGGVVGTEYFASAFSRHSEGGKLTLERADDGVMIGYADVQLHFTQDRRHLKLAEFKRT